MSAEAQVLQLIQGNNKPYGLQSLVDWLAQHGIKKAAIQKALDALAESGKIIAKEFGKTKIFIPPQNSLQVLSKEDLEEKQKRIKELTEQLQQHKQEAKELETELNGWRNSLTDEEIAQQTTHLTKQLADLSGKLSSLSAGTVLVSAEERESAEKALSSNMEAWRKRKAMFKNIWGTVSEGLDGKETDYFEAMGVDTDASVGADYSQLEKLLPPVGAKRLKRS
mmetsp:Transcript_4916/g.10563  ORF Transcript_4916/g.10563 Transcript_4916/m.10563 type:complete len:223 (-) Transcript_4916:334-1002(-)|eukprot:CAMPEP_0202909370 /NCGR_PEP_ID=MMETSP1392-20130828/49141_1 /ASSEMBLY_ACC=CAM_ASM_000868 /TAXON_ID=225041 /ORGANISM="Chlamydomonas chlamydogama, Strain SAG 11-48b" /LENGTH=222 /DNA_ID=CAMNT_0049599101 /DNA_START=292 /DNA_END=960 /DNA_ORIENTATION=-